MIQSLNVLNPHKSSRRNKHPPIGGQGPAPRSLRRHPPYRYSADAVCFYTFVGHAAGGSALLVRPLRRSPVSTTQPRPPQPPTHPLSAAIGSRAAGRREHCRGVFGLVLFTNWSATVRAVPPPRMRARAPPRAHACVRVGGVPGGHFHFCIIGGDARLPLDEKLRDLCRGPFGNKRCRLNYFLRPPPSPSNISCPRRRHLWL